MLVLSLDPDTDVCQTEQPQISYSVDFIAEQSSAMGSPILLIGRVLVCNRHAHILRITSIIKRSQTKFAYDKSYSHMKRYALVIRAVTR